MKRRPPTSTLFPYPPLFRSAARNCAKVRPSHSRSTSTQRPRSSTKVSVPASSRVTSASLSASPSNITAMEKRSEEHTSELQSRQYLVCRLLLEKKKKLKYKC